MDGPLLGHCGLWACFFPVVYEALSIVGLGVLCSFPEVFIGLLKTSRR